MHKSNLFGSKHRVKGWWVPPGCYLKERCWKSSGLLLLYLSLLMELWESVAANQSPSQCLAIDVTRRQRVDTKRSLRLWSRRLRQACTELKHHRCQQGPRMQSESLCLDSLWRSSYICTLVSHEFHPKGVEMMTEPWSSPSAGFQRLSPFWLQSPSCLGCLQRWCWISLVGWEASGGFGQRFSVRLISDDQNRLHPNKKQTLGHMTHSNIHPKKQWEKRAALILDRIKK